YSLNARNPLDVRYWPKADIRSCTAHVRFWGQSGHDRLLMSAFAVAIRGRADMAYCAANVCFDPKRQWRRPAVRCLNHLDSCLLIGRVPFWPHCGTARQAGHCIAILRRLPAALMFGDFQGGHDETSSISYRSWRRRRRRHDRQAGDRAIQPDDQMAIDGELAKITRHALRRL